MRKIEDVTLKNGKGLKEVLELHKKWLEDEKDGGKVDLSYEDLSDVDLSNSNLRYVILKDANLIGTNLIGANLEGADLTATNLTGADLTVANLRGANLRGANLSDADLKYANLKGANLSYANLSYADLSCAHLEDANLSEVKYNHITSFFSLQCPEKGSFIGYKKANDKIVELLITEDAKRSSTTTRKCRCSKAKVLSITSLDGKEEYTKVTSDYDSNFVYEAGKVIEVKDFDKNRWNECSNGILFFIKREEAFMY